MPAQKTAKIFDLQGREVTTLVEGIRQPGNYFVRFNAGGLASGIYFYEIRSNDFVAVRKMVLLN